jgi:hypothetical protein
MSYERHPHAEERRRSAVVLVRTLLEAKALWKAHRVEFLKKALWKVTEADGVRKHETLYRSKASLRQSNDLRHDHVWQRANMVKNLMANPNDVEAILNKAVGCTITKHEHTLLNRFSNLDGWERYRQAGIVVIDMATGAEFKFPKP